MKILKLRVSQINYHLHGLSLLKILENHKLNLKGDLSFNQLEFKIYFAKENQMSSKVNLTEKQNNYKNQNFKNKNKNPKSNGRKLKQNWNQKQVSK